MTIGTHPMEMMRPELDPAVLASDALERTRDGTGVRVAGMVVARQRPATAKGIVFMLLEDEHGTINLIVPPPVVERCRHGGAHGRLRRARGRLEHREGTTNVLVSGIERLERPELRPRPDPSVAARLGPPAPAPQPEAELAAALPPAAQLGAARALSYRPGLVTIRKIAATIRSPVSAPIIPSMRPRRRYSSESFTSPFPGSLDVALDHRQQLAVGGHEVGAVDRADDEHDRRASR